MPGHWEGDLLIGSRNSQIATLVERNTRYAMLARVKSKDSETVINALIKKRTSYRGNSTNPLRGSEMAQNGLETALCPQSPWQRGNENTNGLLRQYFPKGISRVSQNKLNAVARQLNERPRKTLMKHQLRDLTHVSASGETAG